MNEDELFEKIKNRELTICETCDNIFRYIPQKVFCDECMCEKDKARRKAWREKNREKIKANYEENREKKSAYDKAYHEKNREKRNARKRAYYAKNREKLCAYQRAYYAKNREEMLTQQKTKENGGYFTTTIENKEWGKMMAKELMKTQFTEEE